MHEGTVRSLLDQVRAGEVSVDAAVARLRALPFQDLGFAKVDHHRTIRCGFPEVVYCAGKSPEQVARIFVACAAHGGNVLGTRADAEMAAAVQREHTAAVYDPVSRTVVLRQRPAAATVPAVTVPGATVPAATVPAATVPAVTVPGATVPGATRAPVTEARAADAAAAAMGIAIVSAGTSDMSVAEEARVTAEIMDQPCATFYDVGVAGIHRLLAHGEALQSANVVVVVAGMEGALASVVGGIVSAPVIAVPTSVGYGASFHGLAALLAMLNSCAAGVSVVNIDNGFAAGYIAALINRQAVPHRGSDGALGVRA
jgi:hypothetical protein